MFRGWVLAEQGQGEEGITLLRQGLAAYRSTGAKIAEPYFLALLAEAYSKAGQIEEGVTVLDEALTLMLTGGERIWEAELHRLRGELLLAQQGAEPQAVGYRAPSIEVEACFHSALAVARKQQARSLELRAVMSLARLWQQQGKLDDARELLQEIYDWFTEGFDTKDLQDAAALLTALGGQVQQKHRQPPTAHAPPRPESSFVLSSPPPASITTTPQITTRDQSEQAAVTTAGGEAVSSPSPDTTDASAGPSTASQSVTVQLFHQEGEYWTLTFAGTTCRLKDTRGMHYLAQLLTHPNEEVHVLNLVMDNASLPTTIPSPLSSGQPPVAPTVPEGTAVTRAADAGEVFDSQARAAYKQRLADLQAELTEAQAFNDLARADRLQEEIDFLTQELAQAVGLGGRARRTGCPAERARVSVTKALKAAIKRIGKSHPALGQHLTLTIKTGTYCVYTFDSRLPITWQG